MSRLLKFALINLLLLGFHSRCCGQEQLEAKVKRTFYRDSQYFNSIATNREFVRELRMPDSQKRSFKKAHQAQLNILNELEEPERLKPEKDLFEIQASGGTDEDIQAWVEESKRLNAINNEVHSAYVAKLNKLRYIGLQENLKIFDLDQKKRLLQILIQRDGSTKWPFYYFKNDEFLRVASLSTLEKKKFAEYLRQKAFFEFGAEIQAVTKRHLDKILTAVDTESRQRIKNIVGDPVEFMLLPELRREYVQQRGQKLKLSPKLLVTEIKNKELHLQCTKPFINPRIQQELKLTDEQFESLHRVYQETKRLISHVRGPQGVEIKIDESTSRMIIDKKDQDEFEKRLAKIYEDARNERKKILTRAQESRFNQVLTQCTSVEKSVFAFLHSDYVIAKAELSDGEKSKLEAAIDVADKKLHDEINKLVEKETENIYAQLPAEKRDFLKEKFGPPLRFFVAPKFFREQIFSDLYRYEQIQSK
jgi:hypothetical protein